MKIAVICLVLLGLLAAVSAAVLISTLSGQSGPATPAAKPEEEHVEVLLAARELPPMTVVDSSCVITRKVSRSQVPPEALLNAVQVVGKVLTDRMVTDQPFTKGCFAREGVGVYLAAAVPPGKRAMSIQLSDWSGMAGLLYPGSVVDVLVSWKSLGNERGRTETEMMSTTLLQGVQVLAIGSQSIANDNYKDKNPGALSGTGQINFRMVTLLVDPKQAEILQLAMQSGSISLAMRNPLDAEQEARRLSRAREINPNLGMTAAAVSDEGDPFVEETPVERPPAIEALIGGGPREGGEWETLIIRGNEHQIRTFPMPKEPGVEEGAIPAASPQPQSHPQPLGAGAAAR